MLTCEESFFGVQGLSDPIEQRIQPGDGHPSGQQQNHVHDQHIEHLQGPEGGGPTHHPRQHEDQRVAQPFQMVPDMQHLLALQHGRGDEHGVADAGCAAGQNSAHAQQIGRTEE